MICRFRLSLALAVTLTCSTWAQTEPTQERVLQFNLSQSPQSFLEASAAIRAIADIQAAAPDETQRTLTLRATETKIKLADWLYGELTRPAGQHPATSPEYRFSGDPENVVRVFYLDWMKAPTEFLEATTAVRSIADVRRTVPFVPGNAVIMRGTEAQMAFAEWLFQELKPRTTTGSAVRIVPSSYDYASTDRLDKLEHAVKVFRLSPQLTQSEFLELSTVIRSVSEARRAYPTWTSSQLLIRGTPEQMALAEWLYKQFDPGWQSGSVSAPLTVSSPYYPQEGIDDGVRVFFLAKQDSSSMKIVLDQVRAASGKARVYAFLKPDAVVVRGTEGQLKDAERALTTHMTTAQSKNANK